MDLLALIAEPNVAILRAALERATDEVKPLGHDKFGVLADLGGESCMGFGIALDGQYAIVQPVFGRVAVRSGAMSERDRGRGPLLGVAVIFEVDAIPIELAVHGMGGFLIGSSLIDLGEPGFASTFRVEGAPEDLVREILDAPLRARLDASFERMKSRARRRMPWLLIHGVDERSRITRFLPMPGANLFSSLIDEPNPIELRDELKQTLALGARLQAIWRQRAGAIAARGGSVAAAAWEEERRAEVGVFRQTKRSRRFLVGGIIAAVVLLVVCGVTAAACSFIAVTSVADQPVFDRSPPRRHR